MRGVARYLRRHHVALLALFVALGGTSYAAVTLPAGSVGSREIANGAVRAPEVASGAVGAGELRLGAVTSAKVRDGTLLRRDFQPGIMRMVHFARIASSGQLLNGSPGTKSAQLGTGDYEVWWSAASLDTCAVSATVAGDGWAERAGATAANHARVLTHAATGPAANRPFDVVVVC